MANSLTKIVWHDWFPPGSNAIVTPYNETEVDTTGDWDSEDVAASLAKVVNAGDCDAFNRGGKLVIVGPEEYAGVYDITVDYEPVFFAEKVEED